MAFVTLLGMMPAIVPEWMFRVNIVRLLEGVVIDEFLL